MVVSLTCVSALFGRRLFVGRLGSNRQRVSVDCCIVLILKKVITNKAITVHYIRFAKCIVAVNVIHTN